MEAIVLAAIVLVVVTFLGLSRANELFVIDVRSGKARLVRGRMPKAMFDDLADVLGGVPDATVRGVTSDGRPAVAARGRITPEQLQRLRNVVGRFTLAQIRSGSKRPA
jgi:hypothetical protein